MNSQDEYLKANISNMIKAAVYKNQVRFTDFLDEAQQAEAERYLKKEGYYSYLFFGGAEDCVRRALAVFPTDISLEADSFPISAVRVEYSNKCELSHRDFLGSLMGLSIQRCCVGDIIVGDGRTIIFVVEHMADFIIMNLTRVGKNNVSAALGSGDEIVKTQEFIELAGTVSSLRLDCIVAFLLSKSRDVAADAIAAQLVSVNCFLTDDLSYSVKPGDTVVIRKKGKFIIGEETKLTKKGRLYITAKQLK